MFQPIKSSLLAGATIGILSFVGSGAAAMPTSPNVGSTYAAANQPASPVNWLWACDFRGRCGWVFRQPSYYYPGGPANYGGGSAYFGGGRPGYNSGNAGYYGGGFASGNIFAAGGGRGTGGGGGRGTGGGGGRGTGGGGGHGTGGGGGRGAGGGGF